MNSTSGLDSPCRVPNLKPAAYYGAGTAVYTPGEYKMLDDHRIKSKSVLRENACHEIRIKGEGEIYLRANGLGEKSVS